MMRLNMVYLPHLLISLRGTLKPIHFDLREVFWYTDRSVYWKTSLKPIQEKGGFKRGFLGLAHPSLKPCPPLYLIEELRKLRKITGFEQVMSSRPARPANAHFIRGTYATPLPNGAIEAVAASGSGGTRK